MNFDKIYEQIAKKHNVSKEEVIHDMEISLERFVMIISDIASKKYKAVCEASKKRVIYEFAAGASPILLAFVYHVWYNLLVKITKYRLERKYGQQKRI